jgi:hypothetical protein
MWYYDALLFLLVALGMQLVVVLLVLIFIVSCKSDSIVSLKTEHCCLCTSIAMEFVAAFCTWPLFTAAVTFVHSKSFLTYYLFGWASSPCIGIVVATTCLSDPIERVLATLLFILSVASAALCVWPLFVVLVAVLSFSMGLLPRKCVDDHAPCCVCIAAPKPRLAPASQCVVS